jgi:hypothetical protein
LKSKKTTPENKTVRRVKELIDFTLPVGIKKQASRALTLIEIVPQIPSLTLRALQKWRPKGFNVASYAYRRGFFS